MLVGLGWVGCVVDRREQSSKCLLGLVPVCVFLLQVRSSWFARPDSAVLAESDSLFPTQASSPGAARDMSRRC